MLEQQMQRSIKALIDEMPEIGDVLNRFGIGCVQCTVGTCRLGDILKIHSMPAEQQDEMLSSLAAVIYPGHEITLPKSAAPSAPHREKTQLTYSPPVRRLVEEHKLIKRLLTSVPDILAEIDEAQTLDKDLLLNAVSFIRGYADRFHHMKEEDILFDYTDRDAEIIKVIFQDHDQARGFVHAIVKATEENDLETVSRNLEAYRYLLTEHIDKEDLVLYPYIDRGLTDKQVGEMFQRFNEAEAREEADVPERYERFILNLERRYQKVEMAL